MVVSKYIRKRLNTAWWRYFFLLYFLLLAQTSVSCKISKEFDVLCYLFCCLADSGNKTTTMGQKFKWFFYTAFVMTLRWFCISLFVLKGSLPIIGTLLYHLHGPGPTNSGNVFVLRSNMVSWKFTCTKLFPWNILLLKKQRTEKCHNVWSSSLV